MRTTCRATKGQKKCEQYCYSRGRCLLGKVPVICELIEKKKSKTEGPKRPTIKQFETLREERIRLITLKVATIQLKKHDVFYSDDETGDFANTLFFFNGSVKNLRGTIYYCCLTLDGVSDYYSLIELNPNVATIRQYDPETDGDFYGVNL